MAEHPKSKSTGGFNHPDGSLCSTQFIITYLHGDGLDESVVLVHGEDVEAGVAAHVLVDDERARLLQRARVRVGVEGLLVDLRDSGFGD